MLSFPIAFERLAKKNKMTARLKQFPWIGNNVKLTRVKFGDTYIFYNQDADVQRIILTGFWGNYYTRHWAVISVLKQFSCWDVQKF